MRAIISTDTIDTLVTAVIFTTVNEQLQHMPRRADELGERILRLVDQAETYSWTPVAEIAAAHWTPATASNVEAARLAIFDLVTPDRLADDRDLWLVLASLGIALAFRTNRPAASNSTRGPASVTDVFSLAYLWNTPPTMEGSS